MRRISVDIDSERMFECVSSSTPFDEMFDADAAATSLEVFYVGAVISMTPALCKNSAEWRRRDKRHRQCERVCEG